MASMKSPLAAIILIGCCVAWFDVSAGEPEPEGKAKEPVVFVEGPAFLFTAECQVVTLPQKAALKLLPELVDDSKINSAFDRLQTMIAAGEAELVGNLVVKTLEGKKGASESANEMHFPTEWDPPNLPDLKKLPQQDALEIVKNWPLVGFTPTAFETRNLGPQLEFTPLSHSLDGRFFEITVSAKDVQFLGWNHAPAGRTPAGAEVTLEHPHFYSTANTSTLRLQSGQRFLLGVHKIPGDARLMEIFLLRVTATKSPKE